jgi:RNA polymerase sigma-70 factor (ECF subfamily)
MLRADLLSRAQAGDGEAFRELAESHRRELQVHCYRMLGSLQEAEDAVQETLLAAWVGIGGFTQERGSLRTWLYTIATNRCLNARRAARRRGGREWDLAQVEAPVPTPREEAVWLQPFPDHLLEGAIDRSLGPEARYEQREAISLAFVTALQLLPPRQLAVLILRDVLGFHASEVAAMLQVSVPSVTSALKRARARLQRRQPAAGHPPPPGAGSPAEDAIVALFARAWEAADLPALVALLTDDVFIAMPPEPWGYEGRDNVARYWGRQFGAGRLFDLVPTRANGQPAFGAYLRVPAGIRHAAGFYVLTLAGDRICALTRFDTSVLPWFGLPQSLPSR